VLACVLAAACALPAAAAAPAAAAPAAAATGAARAGAESPAGPAAGRAPDTGGAPAPRVRVSLTFDDGFASQLRARDALRARGLRGTFYVNSGSLGEPGRLGWDDVHALAGEGHEIGGHTVDHTHLPQEPVQEQLREICDDRYQLTRAGLDVTTFAYPYGAADERSVQAVQQCGYAGARVTGGLRSDDCPTCSAAESVPPADPHRIRAATSVVTGTSVASVVDAVEAARESGGGWVVLVLHEICDGCSAMAMSPRDLDRLLDWLAGQAPRGIAVQTVADVLDLPAGPAVRGPVTSSPEAVLANGSLAATGVHDAGGSDGTTACWERAGYGRNVPTWRRALDPGTGRWTETVAISSYTDGDSKLLVRQDSGSCAPSVVPGHAYALAASYRSSVPTRLLVYYRTASGHWTYWTASAPYPASAQWRQVRWVTPPLPAGATRLSFGLQLAAAGELSTAAYALERVPVRNWATVAWWVAGLSVLALLVLSGIRRVLPERTRPPASGRAQEGAPQVPTPAG
jgi:peptidoglycan/xylan/chitin deacetylase (PgdA/CDA1 family)